MYASKVLVKSLLINLAGVYTLIVSLFEPGWTGDFNLLVESSLPLSITAIPQEGAGMYHRSMIGSWCVFEF